MGIEESSLFEEIERMGWAEAALPRLPRCVVCKPPHQTESGGEK
jgi:hypothetical protein